MIFHREGAAYVTFVKPITDIQFRVLHALSLERGKHPSANKFLEAAGVSNVTSVKRALVALEKAGLIYLTLGEWKWDFQVFSGKSPSCSVTNSDPWSSRYRSAECA